MNRLLLSFVLAIITFMQAYAQAPKGINYQGVARDNEGKPIVAKNISVRISILKNAANGEVEYTETHKPQTNQFGLFSLIIGQGTAGTGSFTFVSWAVGNKWLQIEIDPEGGSSFQLAGSQQLMSVPYAFYSEYSGNGANLTAGQGIAINEGVISNTGDADNSATNELITGASLTADKKLRITDAGGTKEVDLNTIANTDNQSLSLTGSTLIISGGNSVDLSSALAGNAQNLSLGTSTGTNRTINITNGTSVTLDVADNDNNSTNEIQALTKTGATINLSNGGGSVTLNDDNATNEIQALTKSGSTISLSNGGGSVTLNDDNATNEIQALTKVGTTISLSNGGGAITLNDDDATNEIQNLSQVLTVNPNAGGLRIQNIGNPSLNSDATTKGYVDNVIATNYAFKVPYTFTNSGVAAVNQVVPFGADVYDDFNVVASNRFTALAAGTYMFFLDGTLNNAGINMELRVNSTTIFPIRKQDVINGGNVFVNTMLNTMIKLNPGDFVEVYITSFVPGDNAAGHLFGYKL